MEGTWRVSLEEGVSGMTDRHGPRSLRLWLRFALWITGFCLLLMHGVRGCCWGWSISVKEGVLMEGLRVKMGLGWRFGRGEVYINYHILGEDYNEHSSTKAMDNVEEGKEEEVPWVS